MQHDNHEAKPSVRCQSHISPGPCANQCQWVVASSAPDPNGVGKGMTVLARWPPCGGDRGCRRVGVGDVSQLLGDLGDQQRGPVHMLVRWCVIRT
jgi:hypothetical protein